MASWILDLLSIFHERPDQLRDDHSKVETEIFNCCSRSTSKPSHEDRVFSPRKERQTPWIREGYAPSGRQMHCSANDNMNPASYSISGCDEDVSLLKVEIREVVRAIDEGERRIKILEATACPSAYKTSQQLTDDLRILRAKSSDLSAKLMELEMLTTPRHN